MKTIALIDNPVGDPRENPRDPPGFVIAVTGLMLWYLPTSSLKADLPKWEGFQGEGKGFFLKIYFWLMLSAIGPFLILSFILGTKPLDYTGDGRAITLLAFLPFLMGIFLPFARYLPIKPPPNTPLPNQLTFTLCLLGGFWTTLLFSALATAYFAWGPLGGIFPILAVFLFSWCVTIPAKQDPSLFITDCVALLFLFLTIVPALIPTLIVRGLGIGAYENADLVVEKRCCEALVAEGLPIIENPASWGEESMKYYDKQLFSYILAMNGDTVILRHIDVLLRIGSQIALRDRRQPEKQQGGRNRRIILLPSTQVLQQLSQ
jgi:hypothetical protein